MINDLLDLVKAEAGRLTYDPQTNDLFVLVEDVVTEFETLIEQKRLTLTVEPPSSVCSGKFDRERMSQVVRNFVSNAAKFTPPGRRIAIRIEDAVLPGDTAAPRLTVSDQGGGIPEGELDSVFERSRRTSSQVKGTGLGLAIAREIILAHGGRIAARNNPVGGADFSFILPREIVGTGASSFAIKRR